MKEWQKLKIANLVRVGKSGLAQFTTIQSAINYAASQAPAPSATNPWTVEIYPGIYDEAVTCSTYVNLKGIGPKGAGVIQQTDATIITLATQVQIENLTVRLGTPSADNRRMIIDNGVACTCRLTNIIWEITTPGAFRTRIFAPTAAGNYTLERCSATIGGTGDNRAFEMNGSPTVVLINVQINFTNSNAIIIDHQTGGSVTASFCKFEGTAQMITATGTFYFDNCSLLVTGAWTHPSGTIYIRNSEITTAIVASGGLVRLKGCSYRTVTRSSNGNIVDESPYSLDSIYHVIKNLWQATIATANIATRTAIGGSVTQGGSGQAVLRINDLALDAAGVESPADAAGALASTFDPAKTPRYVQQISANAFRATTTMFFGLRAVLGAAVPGAAEHHAGFIWDGTNFKASSSNGGGVGGTTNLTTPSTGVQHQLEVIILGGVQVDFYVDGALVATHTTAAKIPTAVLYWQEYEISTGAGGATTSDVTLRDGFIQECPT